MDIPIQCPQCQGSDVNTTKVTKKDIPARIIGGVVGFGAAAFGYFAELDNMFDNSTVLLIVRIFMMFIGCWIVWEAVTRLPLPFSGIKLIGTSTERQAVCAGCGHEWTLKEWKDLDPASKRAIIQQTTNKEREGP